MRYGGNTSCVQVTLADGSVLVLDAGTGHPQPRAGAAGRASGPLHILLTHLHLDHIQGLMFFAPMFRPRVARSSIWGPASPEASLRDRIAPLHLGAADADRGARAALPRLVPRGGDDGVADRVGARSGPRRSPTAGRRSATAYEADGSSLCYIPDHEPGLGASLDELEDEWISGFDLARGATLLIHDCQYTDDEYPEHLGWGHSPLSDALAFGRRAGAERLLLFHHDPLHSDDFLDALSGEATERWQDLGGRPDQVELATERRELELRAGAVVTNNLT